jgi:hypothetical protein
LSFRYFQALIYRLALCLRDILGLSRKLGINCAVATDSYPLILNSVVVAARCRQEDIVSEGEPAWIAFKHVTPQFVSRSSRISGSWQDEDYDVFDGEREVGRIYLADSYGDREKWFWGVSFQLTGRKSYGHATSVDEAKAAFQSIGALMAMGSGDS